MTGQETSDSRGLRLYPAPSKNFDPFTATEDDLKRHGLPLRPDPKTQPGLVALWEQRADRYRSFDHLKPQPDTASAAKKAVTAGAPRFSPTENEFCGYSLFSPSAPFTALSVTWTVPNLRSSPGLIDPHHFHTFVGLGSLDVHVEMTVDSAQNVTSEIWAEGVGQVNLPVAPGDVITGSLCLDPTLVGTAHYFLANETRSQTMNFELGTNLESLAFTINAGVARGEPARPPDPLVHFGVVYFDEISAFTTSGTQSLTSGHATTMVDLDGSTLARPVKLNDSAFKTVHAAD